MAVATGDFSEAYHLSRKKDAASGRGKQKDYIAVITVQSTSLKSAESLWGSIIIRRESIHIAAHLQSFVLVRSCKIPGFVPLLLLLYWK